MKPFRDFFTYSANERYGIAVLVFILILISGYNLYLAHDEPNSPGPAYAKMETWHSGLDTNRITVDSQPTRQTFFRPSVAHFQRTRRVIPQVEINTADSAAFEWLPGIGPILARRIIRYRLLLGGFYDPRQLLEVYGIKDSVYRLFEMNLRADTSAIRKININKVTEYDLAKHPYIGRYAASGIIRYRNKQGGISDLRELQENGLLDPENMERIKYYVSL